MIVYQSTKNQFCEDVVSGDIENIILKQFRRKLNRQVSANEVRSWQNSMVYMNMVMNDPEIPGDAGVSIEMQIPQTSKRMDFVVTGTNEENKEHAVIIELKQWSQVERTDKDAVVRARFKHGMAETSHPSYQAWSYSALLEDFNQTVYDENIRLMPCAFLHNYVSDGVIDHPFYGEHIRKAPLFLKHDIRKLSEFIRKYVRYGDHGQLIYKIDKGKIRPSKILADSLASLLKGKEEFIMIDDQKIVFESAMALSRKYTSDRKSVLIVTGGPGTGKSVVAINLLVKMTRAGHVVHYVTKNAAPRSVYESKLTGTISKSRFSNLFKGSGCYTDAGKNEFDVLIVDEAHRLNEKSGLFRNKGENQVKELIRASRNSVFFIDEDQRVTLQDIGTREEIIRWAKLQDADIYQTELTSQFRCNGSDGYLAWLDHILQIRETANDSPDFHGFDFRVMDSPEELRDLIFEKNRERNSARLVAGYCWDWKSKKNPRAMDIIFPGSSFAMKWNLTADGPKWIMMPESVHEVGCIHTCQGLEADYIGVIIGPDLILREGRVLVNPKGRSSGDRSISGYKNMLKKNEAEARQIISAIIRNTYRTLMTRGLKACYVYCTDAGLQQYLKEECMKAAGE